eukprot:151699-Pleurochrysis_carterae.AAC.4
MIGRMYSTFKYVYPIFVQYPVGPKMGDLERYREVWGGRRALHHSQSHTKKVFWDAPALGHV